MPSAPVKAEAVAPRIKFRQGFRLLVITHILATHGLAAIAMRLHLFRPYAWLVRIFLRQDIGPQAMGAQLRVLLERLGPTFIKFGQMLSTRVDLLPLDVALELKKLQDEVPPEDFATIQKVLEGAFKRPLLGEGGSFRAFESEPVAAASIAQVHFAELHDGNHVAVKVRRPRIKKTIEADLALLAMLAAAFDRHFPEYRRLKAPRVVEEFAATIREELNLRAEAAHAGRFAENLQEVEGVSIPRVLWDYTTVEVLTTERIAGIPIDERARLKAAGHDTLKLCERAATLFFHMVFVDGYFHADLHPGNIFVSEAGEILLVDFGIVGRLDMKSRLYLADMLLAFLKQDYRRAAEVHLEANYIPAGTNLSAFEDALREIAEPIFNRPLADISLAELLYSLFSVTERFQMETRPELLLLQKTMVVIEGVGRELESSVNVWTLTRPLVADWVAKHLGPKARVEYAVKEMRDGMQEWLHLPGRLEAALAELRPPPARRPRRPRPAAAQFAAALLLIAGGLLIGRFSLLHVETLHWTGGIAAVLLGAALLLRR